MRCRGEVLPAPRVAGQEEKGEKCMKHDYSSHFVPEWFSRAACSCVSAEFFLLPLI